MKDKILMEYIGPNNLHGLKTGQSYFLQIETVDNKIRIGTGHQSLIYENADQINQHWQTPTGRGVINLISVKGWQPMSEYDTENRPWVLVKILDEDYECLPTVAQLDKDGDWIDEYGELIMFEVTGFFDFRQLK